MYGKRDAVNRVRIEIEPLKLGRLVLEKEVPEGATIKDLLNEAAGTDREVIAVAFDLLTQKLTGAVAVAINNRLIQTLEGLDTKIDDGDVIALIPLLADG